MQRENLPFAAPEPNTRTPTPGTPLGEVTDAALRQLVARQPISIQALRAREYPGSALTVVRTLNPGINYTRQIVSYESDGL
ncbi:hypothetical protein OFN55_41170, partial [Escherichia coli]|nr:hypothetical protein [Escherichia coli]